MTTVNINTRFADAARHAFAAFTKRGSAILAAAAAIVAAIAFSVPAQAATTASREPVTAASAHGVVQVIEPKINERTCNSEEIPRQIWLTQSDGDCRAFGGTVGGMNIGNYFVQWLSAGDYTGTILCNDGPLDFEPGDDRLLNKPCTSIEIRPGS